jgi:hypothetical protein
MMFVELMDEVDTIREAFPGFGYLEAIGWIGAHLDSYDVALQRQFREFMGVGAEFFAEVE